MRICIITPTLSGGGAEKIALNLANHASKSHDTYLICINAVGPYLSSVEENVKLIDLKTKTAIFSAPRLLFELKKIKPQKILSVIVDSNIPTGLITPLLRLPEVFFREANTSHTNELMPRWKYYFYKKLIKLAYRSAKLIIANSEDTKNDLIKNNFAAEHKIIWIPNPVLPENFLSQCNQDLPSGIPKPYIVAAGRLHKQKNYPLLLNAFSKIKSTHPDLNLVILGDGEDKETLIQLAINLGIKESVLFAGFHENPFPFYKNATLFVHTAQWEGFGNVLVEALAAGANVISTDCPGGPRYILENGQYGTLVENNNLNDLVNKLDLALRCRINQPKSGQILHASKFTAENIAKKYLNAMDLN